MSLIAEALQYNALGWCVVPIRPGTKVPHVKWKKYQTQLSTPEELKVWYKKWPNANIGIITGAISGIVAIDIDSPAAYGALKDALGEIQPTIEQTTGREDGGSHLIYTLQKGREVRPAVGLIPKVDIRGDGGLIVVAPSVHKSGSTYTWTTGNPLEGDLGEISPLPEDMYELYQSQCALVTQKNIKLSDAPLSSGRKGHEKRLGISSKTNPDGWVNELLLGVGAGLRNDAAARLAGYYLRKFSKEGPEFVMTALKTWNIQNKPPLDDVELETTVKSIINAEGLKALSSRLGVPVLGLKILKFSDGDVIYRFIFKDQYVEMKPDDLTSVARFRNRMLQLTSTYLLGNIKNAQWFDMLRGILADADIEIMTEQETSLGMVREILYNDVKHRLTEAENGDIDRPFPGNSRDELNSRCIIDGKRIAVKLTPLLTRIITLKLDNISRKEAASILRRMGFVGGSLRLHSNGVVWCYNMDAAQFFKACEGL